MVVVCKARRDATYCEELLLYTEPVADAVQSNVASVATAIDLPNFARLGHGIAVLVRSRLKQSRFQPCKPSGVVVLS